MPAPLDLPPPLALPRWDAVRTLASAQWFEDHPAEWLQQLTRDAGLTAVDILAGATSRAAVAALAYQIGRADGRYLTTLYPLDDDGLARAHALQVAHAIETGLARLERAAHATRQPAPSALLRQAAQEYAEALWDESVRYGLQWRDRDLYAMQERAAERLLHEHPDLDAAVMLRAAHGAIADAWPSYQQGEAEGLVAVLQYGARVALVRDTLRVRGAQQLRARLIAAIEAGRAPIGAVRQVTRESAGRELPAREAETKAVLFAEQHGEWLLPGLGLDEVWARHRPRPNSVGRPSMFARWVAQARRSWERTRAVPPQRVGPTDPTALRHGIG